MSALRNRSVGTELSLLDVKNIEELLDQINKLQQQVSSLQQQLNTVTEEKSVCGLDSPKQRTRQDCDGSVCVCGVGETEAVSTSTPECVCKGEEVEPFQDGDEHTDNGVFKVCLVQPMNCRTAPTPNTHITQEEADDSADDEVSLCAADDWWKESESYGEKSSVCSECGEPFSGPAALRVHTRTHTGDRRFICTCGKRFSYSSSLMRHQKQHCSHSSDSHSVRNVAQVKQRLFQCSFCGKQFSTKTHMTIHERLHTGKKPYECSQCSQAFARPDRLQEHRRVHTGEKPYECSHCGKHFALLGGLKRHRRTHTGEKPYKCTVCKKSFTQSTKLKIHLRTHTGERPYICADCGKTFARTEHLRTHQKIHSAGKRRHRAPRKGSVMLVAHTPEQQTAE